MVRVLVLTQFAFLALGIISLKIMLQANGRLAVSPYLQALNHWVLYLFAVPLVWLAFASICGHVEKIPLTSRVARVIGVLVAIACFGFLVSVTFLT